jgi:hypothetical protein
MAAPQALVGGARSKTGRRLTPAGLAAAIKACASEVWKHEALKTPAMPAIRGTCVAGFVAFPCFVLLEGATSTALTAERHV